MKQYRLNIFMAVLAVVSLTLGMSCSSNNDEKPDDPVVVPPVEEKVPEVTDVSNTDCQYDSRSTTRNRGDGSDHFFDKKELNDVAIFK